MWNDDFHHTAVVALTGRNEAYYSDYRGTAQELASAVRWGFLYQGQRYAWQKKGRGTPALDLPAERFVTYLENHDQVANTARGARLATSVDPGRLRAMTALLLLGPSTPMLFQGQEWGRPDRFVYFADHDAKLAAKVAAGRLDFLSQFPSLASEAIRAQVPAPGAAETFASCKLDWSERERHAPTVALHRDLLRLRREDPAFAAGRRELVHAGGAGRPGAGAAVLLAGAGRRRRPAADRQPGARPPPRVGGRAAARPAGRAALAHGVVQRGSALRRRRHRAGRDRRGPAPARPRRDRARAAA